VFMIDVPKLNYVNLVNQVLECKGKRASRCRNVTAPYKMVAAPENHISHPTQEML